MRDLAASASAERFAWVPDQRELAATASAIATTDGGGVRAVGEPADRPGTSGATPIAAVMTSHARRGRPLRSAKTAQATEVPFACPPPGAATRRERTAKQPASAGAATGAVPGVGGVVGERHTTARAAQATMENATYNSHDKADRPAGGPREKHNARSDRARHAAAHDMSDCRAYTFDRREQSGEAEPVRRG